MILLIILFIICLNLVFLLVWCEKLLCFGKSRYVINVRERVCVLKKQEIKGLNYFLLFNFIYLIIINKSLNRFLGNLVLSSEKIELLKAFINLTYDYNDIVALFLGISTLLVVFFVHILGIKNKFDKKLLHFLIKEDKLCLLYMTILTFLIFNGNLVYLIGGIGFIVYLLFYSVVWIYRVEDKEGVVKNYEEIKKKINEEEFIEIYDKLKESIMEAVKDGELAEIKKYLKIYRERFMSDGIVEENFSGLEALFLSDLYGKCLRSMEDDIFDKVKNLHIDLASEYFRKGEIKGFEESLILMEKVYEYHYNHTFDKFKSSVVSGMEWKIPEEIWERLSEDKEEAIKWYSAYFSAIVTCIKRAVGNKDYGFTNELLSLIDNPFGNRVGYNKELLEEEKELYKEYYLLESSVYFGLVLYLENIDEVGKNEEIKKIINGIKENRIQYYSFDLGLGDYDYSIELYDFIKKFKVKGLLKWEEIFMPKMNLVGVTVWEDETEKKVDKLFLELLAISGVNNNIYKFSSSKDKLNNEVLWLIQLLEREKFEREMEGVKEFLNTLRGEVLEEKGKKIRKSKLDNKKNQFMKEKIESLINTSSLIKFLKQEGKYIISDESKEDLKQFGIWQFYPKDEFVEGDNKGYLKELSKSLGEAQNKGVEKLFTRGLKGAEEEKINEALKGDREKVIIVPRGLRFKFIRKFQNRFKENNYLDKNIIQKYCGLLIGLYEFDGRMIPVLSLDSEERGAWVIDLNDIKEFVHYKVWDEQEEDRVGYTHFSVKDVKELLEDPEEKEKLLNLKWLEGIEEEKDKIKELEKKVWLKFYQKGELILGQNAEIYKISEENLLKESKQESPLSS